MASPLKNLEVCPECGEFVPYLMEVTGFCRKCSSICEVCGRPSGAKICNACKVEIFLRDNADHIEHYMAQGFSVFGAIDKVRSEVRPTCASCGGSLKRAPRSAIFCRKTPQCRKASRRYVYFYTERGMSKSEALAKVLIELS